MIKHVGQVTNTGRRCVVVFREIYNDDGKVVDPNSCLIVETDALPDAVHQDIIRIVESEVAQRDSNLFNVLHRERLSDGNTALAYLNKSGRLRKFPTSQILLTPDANNTLRLDKMNTIIRMQAEGRTNAEISEAIAEPVEIPDPIQKPPEPSNDSEDIAPVVNQDQPQEPDSQESDNHILSDEQIAKSKYHMAKQMMAEAENLLNEAYTLDDSLKPRRGRPKKSKNS